MIIPYFSQQMALAIAESRLSTSEDYIVFPYVGVVICNLEGRVISQAHKGERDRIEHAEQIAIAKAMEVGFEDFSESILFTTLEPCTYRKFGRTSCAQKMIDLKFRQVYIGALDPHPTITGQGEQYLRIIGNMEVERFPTQFEREIRKINKSYYELCFREKPSHLFSETISNRDETIAKLKNINVEFATFVYSKITAKTNKIDNTTPLITETFSGQELDEFCRCVGSKGQSQ